MSQNLPEVDVSSRSCRWRGEVAGAADVQGRERAAGSAQQVCKTGIVQHLPFSPLNGQGREAERSACGILFQHSRIHPAV